MDPLKRRVLGSTGLELTQLGLGGTSVGSLYGPVDDETATATVRRAYELGVRYFDTAPYYGHGSSERRFGAALAQRPRGSYVLSTKVGRLLVADATGETKPPHFRDSEPFRAEFDFSRDGVLRSIDASRARLGIETFDILYVHDCQDQVEAALEGALPALAELRARGEIAAVGAGLNVVDTCLALARDADLDCLLLANRYTLLEQGPLDALFPLCQERGIGIVIGGPFNSGILATGPVEGARYDYRPAPAEVVERVRLIEAVCAEHGVALPAAALQFPLAHPLVASVVCGARTEEEVMANVALMAAPIPAAFWEALKAKGLLREDAPTPV